MSGSDAAMALRGWQDASAERDRLAQALKDLTNERDWLAKALQDQEEAYAALEASYLALTDAYTDLVDRLAALAPEVIAS